MGQPFFVTKFYFHFLTITARNRRKNKIFTSKIMDKKGGWLSEKASSIL